MTTTFTSDASGILPPGDSTELELAEADLAAADAEAAAAQAQAQAARARARFVRLRGTSAATDTESPAESPVPATEEEASSPSATDEAKDQAPDDAAVASADVANTDPADPPPPSKVSRLFRTLSRRLAPLRHPTKRGLALLTTALITVGALVVTVFIGVNHNQVTDENARVTAFTAAANRGVETITSLDFRNAKRDIQRVLDQSTGAFYDDFNGRSEDFASVIEQSQVTTKGKVTASAIESIGDNQAVVLVAANSDVTNAAGAEQEPRVWRLRVTVTEVDGNMKISKVDFVP